MSQVKGPEPDRAGWDPGWAKFMSEADKPQPSQGPASDTGNIVANAGNPPPQKAGSSGGAAPPPEKASPQSGGAPREGGQPTDARQRADIEQRIGQAEQGGGRPPAEMVDSVRGPVMAGAPPANPAWSMIGEGVARSAEEESESESQRAQRVHQDLQGVTGQLEEIRSQADRQLEAGMDRNTAASDFHWANTQLGRLQLGQELSELKAPERTESGRDPDLIFPDEEIRLPTKPAEQPPEMAAPSTEEIRQSLAEATRSAAEVSINDPLRSLADRDPVSYGQTKLAMENNRDAAYLNALSETAPEFRREYTVEEVDRLMGEATAARERVGTAQPVDPKERAKIAAESDPHENEARKKERQALDVLSVNMDAAESPEQRQAIYESAGEAHFAEAFFQQRMREAAPETVSDRVSAGGPGASPDDPPKIVTRELSAAERANRIGDLLLAWDGAAPPQVANTMLDAAQAELPEQMLDGRLFGDLAPRDTFYRGLSKTVEAADALGGNRAQETARWLLQDVHEPQSEGPGGGGRRAGEIVLDPLADAVRTAVSQGEGAGLSMALINELPKVSEGARFDADDSARSALLEATSEGLKGLGENTVGAVEDWREKNGEVLFLQRNFADPGRDGKAAEVVNEYRRTHLDKAHSIDAAADKAGQWGADLHQAWQAVTRSGFDPTKATEGAEQQLADTVKGLGNDPAAAQAMAGSAELERQIGATVSFGRPPGPESLTGAMIQDHAEHVERLLPELRLGPGTERDVLAVTEQWQDQAMAEANKDTPSQQRLAALTERYDGRLREQLAQAPEEATEKLLDARRADVPIQPAGFDQTGWYAWGARAARNFVMTGADMTVRRWMHEIPTMVESSYQSRPGLLNEILDDRPGDKRLEALVARREGAYYAQWERVERQLDRMEKFGSWFGLKPDNAKTLNEQAKNFIRLLEHGDKNGNPLSNKRVAELVSTFERQTSHTMGVPVQDIDPAIHAGSKFGMAMRGVGLATFGTQFSSAAEAWEEGRVNLTTVAYPIAWGMSAAQESQELYAGIKNRTMGANALAKEYPTWRAFGRAVPLTYLPADLVWTGQSLASGDYANALAGAGLAGSSAASIAQASGKLSPAMATKLGLGGPMVMGASVAWAIGVFQHDRVQQANELEAGNNPDMRRMVMDLGFTEAQTKELLNQTKDGVSPMVALSQVADLKGATTAQMLDHLRDLHHDDIGRLVNAAHFLIDHHGGDEPGNLPETAPNDESAGKNLDALLGRKPEDQGSVIVPPSSLQGLVNFMENQGTAFTPPPAEPAPEREPVPPAPLKPPEPSEPPPLELPTRAYRVQPGDTLWDIAEEYAKANDVSQRVALDKLFEWNPQFDPGKLG